VPSQRKIFKITENYNQIFTLSYWSDGARLATAGKDFTLRIYDEETKALTRSFKTGVFRHSENANRVFFSKWKTDYNNILLGLRPRQDHFMNLISLEKLWTFKKRQFLRVPGGQKTPLRLGIL